MFNVQCFMLDVFPSLSAARIYCGLQPYIGGYPDVLLQPEFALRHE